MRAGTSWSHRQSVLAEREFILFTLGGARMAAPLESVAGVLTGFSGEIGDRTSLIIDGERLLLLRAEDVLDVGARTCAQPRAVLIIRRGPVRYAVAVDSSEDVIRVAPGDGLYRFPPTGEAPTDWRRPWGILELGDVPILLVDFGPVRTH